MSLLLYTVKFHCVVTGDFVSDVFEQVIGDVKLMWCFGRERCRVSGCFLVLMGCCLMPVRLRLVVGLTWLRSWGLFWSVWC